MSPKKLSNLLNELPQGSRVEVNTVGNLRVTDANDKYLGFIDFNSEEMELFA
jgi:hypothetical protein